MALQDKATTDGYDLQMQTNHLSHFLLAKELYPAVKAAAAARGEARIVHHSSISRNWPADLPMTADIAAQYLGKNGRRSVRESIYGTFTPSTQPARRWQPRRRRPGHGRPALGALPLLEARERVLLAGARRQAARRHQGALRGPGRRGNEPPGLLRCHQASMACAVTLDTHRSRARPRARPAP